jgi:hypothetical protein
MKETFYERLRDSLGKEEQGRQLDLPLVNRLHLKFGSSGGHG